MRGRAAALEEIRKLLADRDRLYARAQASIDTTGKTVKESLSELKKAIADRR
jgi:XRE family aerobic/anaerobic benzoate catabolism transcriptional regulator